MIISLRSGFLLMVLGAFLALPGAANATIQRHCDGYLSVRPLGGIDKNGKSWTQTQSGMRFAIKLKGRGSCKNKLKANTCRRKARDLIVKCAQDIWAQRWKKKNPASCIGIPASSRDYATAVWWGGTSQIMHRLLKNDPKRAMEYTACCVMRPGDRMVRFKIFLHTLGDKGCKSQRLVEDLYKADCAKLRARGLCGTPKRAKP